MDAQPLDTPLWEFSLAIYGAEGVADECLALQERLGLDVNILLMAAFLGAVECIPLTRADIASANDAVSAWQREIVRPLRAVRKALKPLAQLALRAEVKAAELHAEKIELSLLWQWSQVLTGRPRGDALAGNLAAALVFYDSRERPSTLLPRLIAAAATYRA